MTVFVNIRDFSPSFPSTVGKTSLITRFMYDSFDNTYQVSWLLTTYVRPILWLFMNKAIIQVFPWGIKCIIHNLVPRPNLKKKINFLNWVWGRDCITQCVYICGVCLSVCSLAHNWDWLLFQNCVLGGQNGKTHTAHFVFLLAPCRLLLELTSCPKQCTWRTER